MYWAIRLLLPGLLLGVSLLLMPLLPKLSMTIALLIALAALGVGWLAPAVFVDKRKEARINRLRAAFPDALDLMVVCVESGLALPQAIERVADEMAVSQAELAEELALVNVEIRAGIPATKALKHLAERTGLEDVQGLVSLLSQSIRFGTSVADTLRIYAEEFRDRRTQAAEEQAAKIGTKLVFPLIFCLWPSFFLVAIGPVILGILKTFGKL
jgi:tight adherence protein C